MNKGRVCSGRVGRLYRQAQRRRAAGLATSDAYERAMTAFSSHAFWLWIGIYNDSHAALHAWSRRHNQFRQRLRLAQVKGWGPAGECPAFASAKTPAVRERVSRVAAVGAGATRGARRVACDPRRTHAGDHSARVSAPAVTGQGVV